MQMKYLFSQNQLLAIKKVGEAGELDFYAISLRTRNSLLKRGVLESFLRFNQQGILRLTKQGLRIYREIATEPNKNESKINQ